MILRFVKCIVDAGKSDDEEMKLFCVFIQGVTGGTDQTSGECSLGQSRPI